MYILKLNMLREHNFNLKIKPKIVIDKVKQTIAYTVLICFI